MKIVKSIATASFLDKLMNGTLMTLMKWIYTDLISVLHWLSAKESVFISSIRAITVPITKNQNADDADETDFHRFGFCVSVLPWQKNPFSSAQSVASVFLSKKSK